MKDKENYHPPTKHKLASTKKVQLEEHPEFSITIGTEFKLSPAAIWMEISTWLVIEESLTKRDISKLNKEIRQVLWDTNDLVFDCKRTILNISYPETLKYTRDKTPHFLMIDLTCFQHKNLLDWTDYNLQISMQWYAELILEILNSKVGWQFTKKRRKKTDLITEC